MLIGALQGAVVAALLAARRTNRQANAVLAVLLIVFVLRLVPYIIGFAGFYEVYPWLSFAPFALTLAYGPLIYLYVARITADRMPARWWVHLIPAAIQLAYYLVIFVQPLAFKNAFNDAIHVPRIDPIESLLTFVSLGGYLAAAMMRYRTYKNWLNDATSDPGEHSLAWIRTFLIIFSLATALNIVFEIVSRFVRPLNYYNYFWLYLWFAVLIYYLGLEGWRNANRTYPQPVLQPAIAPSPKAAFDWSAAAKEWLSVLRHEGYWRDSELTLATLAATMQLSPAHISRLVNEGLGQNFNEAINRMRVEAVQRWLEDPADTRTILELAHEAGFSSKASFNRSFKAYVGMTPTEFRTAAVARARTGG